MQQQAEAATFSTPLHSYLRFSSLNSRGQPSITHRAARSSGNAVTPPRLDSYRHWLWRPPPRPWCLLCRGTPCHSAGLLRLPPPLRPPSHRLRTNDNNNGDYFIEDGQTREKQMYDQIRLRRTKSSFLLGSIKICAAASVSGRMPH